MLGYPVPTIIERIDDDDAKIQIADGNLHRDKISSYDLSRSLRMKMDAMKQKVGRRKKSDPGYVKMDTDEIIAKEMGISVPKLNRIIRLSEILLQIKADEDMHRQLCGSEYQENDFIFKWPNGKPFSPDYISSHFALLLKNNHLPHIRFHELRHSCASLLLNSGFTLKDVQEYMGHSDIQMTANIYGHLDTQRKNLLTERITASIF